MAGDDLAGSRIVRDERTQSLRCLDCLANDEAARTAAETIEGLGRELAHLKDMHTQTLARKSNVMQDWLRDQTLKWKLRCQIREAGNEPIG